MKQMTGLPQVRSEIISIQGLLVADHWITLKLSYQKPGSIAWVHVEWSGFLARVAQHEIDHLDGLLWLDRIEDNREIVSEAQYLAKLR